MNSRGLLGEVPGATDSQAPHEWGLGICVLGVSGVSAKKLAPGFGRAQMSEGDVGGLGDTEYGLVAGELFPGSADGVDLVAVFLGVRVIDDEELRAEALGRGLIFALPLAVDVEDAEAIGEARGDFAIEEVAPSGF